VGYDPSAASFAAEITQRTRKDARIIEGAKSTFDVPVDDRLIFSKQGNARLPERDEIVSAPAV
jgi:Rdx family